MLQISFQQRLGLLACKLTKKRRNNFPTDNIKGSAKVVRFLNLYIKTTRSSYFLRNISKWLLCIQLVKKNLDSVVFLT